RSIFELLTKLVSFWIKVNTKPRAAQLLRERKRIRNRSLVPNAHHHVGRRRDQAFRKHIALTHHHNNSFQPKREAARRHASAKKHADQTIVSASATEAPRKILYVDLHDRSSVVQIGRAS